MSVLTDARNYSFSQVPYLELEEKENLPINLRKRLDVILYQVHGLDKWPDKPGRKGRKSFQTLERQSERTTGLEDPVGNFWGNKTGNWNTTWSKPLGLEVDQTVKPNQTSLALCLLFLLPSHYQQMLTKGRFYTKKLFTPKYQDMIQK